MIEKYKKAIQESISKGLLTEKTDVLTGYSGEKLVGCLQRLSQIAITDNSCYVEVGVFQGLTLLSVGQAIPQNSVYGIDNFAFFDPQNKNLDIVKERQKKLNLNNVEIVNEDYEDALEQLKKHIGEKQVAVYFIDGPHDYRSQLMCLELIKPYLAENAIILVDDCNYLHVRQANRDFLKINPTFKLLFEAYTNVHPLNLNESDRKLHQKGWWDGVNIIVHDPKNELKEKFPPTIRNRALFENDHATHATKYPEAIPYLLPLVNILGGLVYKTAKKLKNKEGILKGKYKAMNTFSEKLPLESFND
jgi:predicted O-methyltransferase YrrM